jgi:hypothetical protein
VSATCTRGRADPENIYRIRILARIQALTPNICLRRSVLTFAPFGATSSRGNFACATRKVQDWTRKMYDKGERGRVESSTGLAGERSFIYTFVLLIDILESRSS